MMDEYTLSKLMDGGIKELCIAGLLTDGAHHKQWFIERILIALGFDLDAIREELNTPDYWYDWERGIAP